MICFSASCRSPGFGISLVAETTSGCFISTDTVVSYARGRDNEEDEMEELMPPEEIGERAASMLLGEIEQGGVVDSTHQVCELICGIFWHPFPSLLFPSTCDIIFSGRFCICALKLRCFI